jgi:hypothetical protein
MKWRKKCVKHNTLCDISTHLGEVQRCRAYCAEKTEKQYRMDPKTIKRGARLAAGIEVELETNHSLIVQDYTEPFCLYSSPVYIPHN